MSTVPRIGSLLGSLEQHVGNFAIEALCGHLKAEWIDSILASTRRESQRLRDLPADLMVWIVIAMGLFRSLSVENVLAHMRDGFRGRLWPERTESVTSSAITQARKRLGLKPLVLLFRLLADSLRDKFAPQNLWRGLKQVALDGSSGKTPDSEKNRRKFGGPKSHRGRSGYPFLRFVTLVAVETHIALAAAVGVWSTSEVTLAMNLVASIEPNSLVLLDRGLLGYSALEHCPAPPKPLLGPLQASSEGENPRKAGPWRLACGGDSAALSASTAPRVAGALEGAHHPLSYPRVQTFALDDVAPRSGCIPGSEVDQTIPRTMGARARLR